MEDEARYELSRVFAKVAEEGKDVVIRTGKALEMRDRIPVNLSGCIDTPARYCECKEKGVNAMDYVVAVYRAQGEVVLNNFEPYQTYVRGVLVNSSESEELGINDGKYVTPGEMAERIKMNRTMFDNRSQAMELVSQLRNFRAKVNQQIEKSDDKRGNASMVRMQAVESNVPKEFQVWVRPFEGQAKVKVNVEVYIKPDDLTCTLVSADYIDNQKETKDALIDDVIKRIQEAVPGMCVYES